MNNSTQEIWKVAPQYTSTTGQHTYEVSNNGRVRRILYYGKSADGMLGNGKRMPVTQKTFNGDVCVLIRQDLKSSLVRVSDIVNSVFEN